MAMPRAHMSICAASVSAIVSHMLASTVTAVGYS